MEKQPPCPGSSGQHSAHAHVGSLLDCSSHPGSNSLHNSMVGIPLAPPRTPPDQASIQSSMDKNKESLKRKLMLRRSVNELVDRGIYPPLKTPPAFAEKTKQLERAKTGDLLRHKIQQRPHRQLLVQQHILEDTTIDPSLHERQRLLKRSRLVDGLNDKLAHRPGPLELVQGNILQPSQELANAIKDGTIQFIPTCDTEDMDQSSSSFMFDEESAGSDGTPSPSMDESSGLSDVCSPCSAPPLAFTEALPFSFTFTKGIPIPVTVNKCPQIPVVCSNPIISASSSPSKVVTSQTGTSNVASTSSNVSTNNNNNNNKFRSKKPKPKAISKSRIIKFHEYKGPPSVVKGQSSNTATPPAINSTEDTPYHILLQQQQLFLQWQLEFQQKQQQGSALSPTSSAVVENTAATPTMSSIIVTTPLALSSTSLSQPPTAGNGSSSSQSVSLNQSQISGAPAITQTVFNSASIPSQTSAVQSATSTVMPSPPVPPPPPLPPARPTQSVAPRQSTKALTSIPASALSLPKLTGNLEEMKVAELKAELKKRSLPVSGPKPQLIERLKPFTESSTGSQLLSSASSKSNSTPSSRVSTPLHINQTFHVKTEPNGDITTSSILRFIPSTTAMSPSISQSLGTNCTSSSFSVAMPQPLTTQGFRTVASVKPMVKEEPMTTTDISPPSSPPNLLATTPGTTTPMSPDYEITSPPSLISELKPPITTSTSQNMPKSSKVINNKLMMSGGQNNNSLIPRQTVITMTSDIPQTASVVPAEMMPMEVDSVSVDLNQGVDDTAFKAASLGHGLDSTEIKALIQPFSSSGCKTISFCQDSLDDNITKSGNVNLIDNKPIKTINLNTNYDNDGIIKTINISPNTDPATIKTLKLGSNQTDSSPFKNFNLNQATDNSGFKTINISPTNETSSLLKTVKVPLTQLSSAQVSPVQLTAPLTHTFTSPTSLLQLQQLQQLHTLQQLQQQLIQQTQQQQFTQQPSQAATLQLNDNDQVVLAQAKQIEELQRQLQESHIKLKLQQLQQQMQQQQQQQQQLWQVRIPSNFAQNSIVNKLSSDPQTITPQINQVMTTPLQLQQPTASVVQQQQQPGSMFLNGHTIQRTPLVVTGLQHAQLQAQQPAPLGISNQAVLNSGINNQIIGLGSTVASDNNILTMAKSNNSQQTNVSLPYAIHINLTGSGQVKLPEQLQPITTSTATATTAKPSTAHLPVHVLLNPSSNNILTSQTIKSEPSSNNSMGPPTSASVPKSQVTSGQPLMLQTDPPSTKSLVPGHTNGVVPRTSSVPSSIDQQKQNIQRCSSAPYFSGPLKEPPRYDEAMKIKQLQTIPQVTSSSNNNNNQAATINKSLGQVVPDIKSQTMDDVLEILIRNGDLPPSAATEALPSAKTTTGINTLGIKVAQTNTDTACNTTTSSLMVAPASLTTSAVQSQPQSFPTTSSSFTCSTRNSRNQPRMNSTSPRDQTLTSVHTNILSDSLLNDTHSSSPLIADSAGSSSFFLNEGTSNSDGGEMLYWGEMIPSPDLSNMDWSVESGFGHLDLGDSNLNFDSKIIESNASGQDHDDMQGLDTVYTTNTLGLGSLNNNINYTGFHTPGQDLINTSLSGGLGETIDPSNQMDMSEWLDVMMPNSNINLDPAPSSLPFSVDPILSPPTRHEVFDIFDFSDSDINSSVNGWDKLMKQETSS